ncbi:MAG: response regulator transcription factor [bacterium]
MRILIVEDEEALARSLKQGLEKEGFTADYVSDGEVAERRINMYHKEYDVIILDLMLPKRDGFEVCRNVRAAGVQNPIIVLTARYEISDKVRALDAGADDYLVKPFSLNELIARLHALLRRPNETLPAILEVGSITLNPITRQVERSGKPLKLTVKEYALLEYLMRHPGQVLNRDQIQDHLWGFDFDSFSNVVDVHIKNLRRKIETRNHKLIETIRGIGYKLVTQ